ncbi:MAG: blaI 11 [Phycisphaerales bacterium]|jgi:BlaI family penicillinase repressor|nr:blaI 11 [Phycisphaerales bacterium]MDB5305487.1 blaI 11 [Phycisphaerales bacterium]
MAKVPQISDAEWEVMKLVWGRGPLVAADVVEALAAQNHWSPRTVKTLLNRLVKKGALGYEVAGRHYVYRARVTRDACVRRASSSFLSRVFNGNAAPALAHFLEHEDLSAEEIEQLRRILDGAREQEGRP